MEHAPQSPAANETIVSRMPRSVQIIRVKRQRDATSANELQAYQRNQRVRKSSKETIFVFKSGSLVYAKPKQQGRTERRHLRIISRNPRWPLRPRMMRKRDKANGMGATLGHGRSQNKKKRIVDMNIRDRTQKFLPYRQEAFSEEHVDYLVAVYNQIFRQSGQELSVNEELIEAYNSSTCAEERRLLRKHFAVVRGMVAAEEGRLSEDAMSDESIYKDEYDYYVEEDDPLHFDQFLDEAGNLIEGITFEVDEDYCNDPDCEFYVGNDCPSDGSDSVKDNFGP